jgi:cytochrome c5
MRRAAISFGSVLLIVAMALPSTAQRGGGRRQVELPTGPARKVILKSCTVCHGLDPYATRALDKEGWRKEVESMKQKGAEISDSDADILIEYLVNNFGPDSAPAPARPAAPANPAADAAARKILDTACTACHSLQRVDAQNQPQEAWEGTVANMRRRGARVTDEEVVVLIEYLARTHGVQ